MSTDETRPERIERLPERLPLFGDELPQAHVSLHALRVRDGEAWFDDEAIHGLSAVMAGIRWVDSLQKLASPERWQIVWVAVDHGIEGGRAYTGLAADEFWIDRSARLGYRDVARHAERMDAAMRGRILLATLDATAREAVRRALLMRDPDAWDRAPEAVHRALRPGTDRPAVA
jgi:hypothetical protein